MTFTTEQLIALLVEARGMVHESLMGAIWTKERHARYSDFVDKTREFEVIDIGNISEKDAAAYLKKMVDKYRRNLGTKSKSVITKNIQETETTITVSDNQRGLIATPPHQMSIDQEVAWQRTQGVIGSRDQLRLLVKNRREGEKS